tara:strand:+ start:5016 stop:5342 length:327 start_codon:yes stop_codon:yes gene_type:complete
METPIQITTNAEVALRQASLDENSSLIRIGVVGGGCSGYSYVLDFENEHDEDDLVMQFEEFGVVIDPHSAGLLQGVQLDYVQSLQKKGFVFENPNASTTCGCGSSFSV